MTGIIVPENPLSSIKKRPFGDLTEEDQRQYVQHGFEKLLARSYMDDTVKYGVEYARRKRTDTEKKRRADILAKWFRKFRGEYEMSINRALDECGHALRAELDGRTYEPPPKSRLWTPEWR